MRLVVCSIALSLAAAGPAVAEDAEKTGPWSGHIDLGALQTNGNSNSLTLSAAAALDYNREKWGVGIEAAGIGARSEIEDTDETEASAEQYNAALKGNYNLTDRDYLFGRIDWFKDRFAGYERRLTETVGYGHRFLDREVHSLDLEIGVGARQDDFTDDAGGGSSEEMIGRGALAYLWKFSESGEFSQRFAVVGGSDNVYTESDTALRAALMGGVGVTLGYKIMRNDTPPAGKDRTDMIASVALGYKFGK